MSEKVEELQPLLEEDQLDLDDMDTVGVEPRKRRFPIWAIIVIVVIALIASVTSYYLLNRTPAIQYTQGTATTGNLSVKVSASGPLSPNAEYTMNFPAAGQITEIDVKVGQHVTKGQTLAKLSVTSTGNYANNNNNNNNSPTVDTLTAPGDATIAVINGAVGENVSSSGTVSSGSGGSSQGTGSSSGSSVFMTLVDVSKYNIQASINESDINSIKIGQPAQFTVSAYPSKTLRATVSAINILGQTSSSVVTYAVTLTVDMSSLTNVQVYPGMTATVDITTAQRLNTLLIPSSALTFPTTALQNGEISRSDYVAALQSSTSNSSSGSTSNANGATTSSRVVMELKNGKLTPVAITVGLSSGQSVEVLSGLQDGDQVVIGQTGGNTTTTGTGTGTGTGTRRGTGGFGGGAGGFGGGAGGFGGGAGGARSGGN
ncbi:efflux RND transporter periplasmic adaptor subunit [Dictyobacter arantiisoli]|uniref:Hemolysin D n=1 Tax=Dictyobacter arantiisoli TaxID=2014874 RepID=A0A5A5TBI6_9CHLR|nr:HlyD family efflux transporter periplasmic adaptor subunit [Dictyobacter arantiisoli]GCF08758.1 hemolysin D [Dictyobacter arantiisoli]